MGRLQGVGCRVVLLMLAVCFALNPIPCAEEFGLNSSWDPPAGVVQPPARIFLEGESKFVYEGLGTLNPNP